MIAEVLRLEPFLLEVIWGGRTLQGRYGKDFPEDRPLGEAWEISCLPGRECRIFGSERTLAEVHRTSGAFLVGQNAASEPFPFLIKLISTDALLSVQVHPDDAAAKLLDDAPCGKHEAWWILETEPDAHLYLGLVPGATKGDLAEAVRLGHTEGVTRLLRRIDVQPGDVFDVPPGTVHALGPGLTLIEAQQPSDLTYRLFDWERLGLDGKPRDLHLERALRVMDETSRPESRAQDGTGSGFSTTLVENDVFRLERWRIDGELSLDIAGLAAIVCVFGHGTIGRPLGVLCELSPGTSCVIPAGVGIVTVSGCELVLAVTRPSRTPRRPR